MTHQVGICQYHNWYHNTRTGDYVEYNCKRSSLCGRNLCIFHDEHFFKTNEDKVRDAFLDEFDRETRINPETPLCYVGCNIPSIDLNHVHNVSREVYFVKTNFHGDVKFFDIDFTSINFSFSKFFGDFKLSNVNVNDFFIFSNVEFDQKDSSYVEFENCTFETSRFSLTDFFHWK